MFTELVEEVLVVFTANEDALLDELAETADKLFAPAVVFVEAGGALLAVDASVTTGGVIGSVPLAAAASVEFSASTAIIGGSSSSSSSSSW